MDQEVIGEPIYDYAAFGDIKKKFPSATYEDASDMIHDKRIIVSIPGTNYREFFKHALDCGYHVCSLTFQFLLLSKEKKEPEFWKLVNQWLEDNDIKKNSPHRA